MNTQKIINELKSVIALSKNVLSSGLSKQLLSVVSLEDAYDTFYQSALQEQCELTLLAIENFPVEERLEFLEMQRDGYKKMPESSSVIQRIKHEAENKAIAEVIRIIKDNLEG